MFQNLNKNSWRKEDKITYRFLLWQTYGKDAKGVLPYHTSEKKKKNIKIKIKTNRNFREKNLSMYYSWVIYT